MTVQQAIAAAEALLPGRAAPKGRIDPRWQAMIAVGEFIETEADAVWFFIRRWGRSTDSDLRSAVATCLLEHLLENHFDRFIPLVEQAALQDQLFADTVCQCWRFGQAEESDRAVRLERLVAAIRKRTV